MVVGFTGRQAIDHPEHWVWVREQFEQVMREVAGPGDRAASSLAAGGDQLFSEVAVAAGLTGTGAASTVWREIRSAISRERTVRSAARG